MTNIRKIEEKTGPSFKITVTKGRDLNGKQIRHYRTWTPPHPMTERQMEKEVQRTALDFEREIALGYQMDNRSKEKGDPGRRPGCVGRYAEKETRPAKLRTGGEDKSPALSRDGSLMMT